MDIFYTSWSPYTNVGFCNTGKFVQWLLFVHLKSKTKQHLREQTKIKLDFVINLADRVAFDFVPDILNNCLLDFFF